MGGVYTGKYYFRFDSLSDIIDWMLSKSEGFYYAHNLAFDGVYLMSELHRRNVEHSFKDCHGKLMEVKILKRWAWKINKKNGKKYKDKHFIIIRDSFSLFPVAQKALAEMFCVPTQKLDVDFKALERMKLKDALPIYEERNRTDCIGLHEILTKAQKEVLQDFGVDIRKCMTTAQLSLKSFRTKYLGFELFNPVVMGNFFDREVTKEAEFFSEAYAGGRVEVFDMNEHRLVNGYDVNSMYPSVMRENVPIGKYKVFNGITKDNLLMLMGDYEGFAEVTVSTREQDFPVLWKKIEGKLMFPNFDHSTGVFPFPELKRALETGMRIHEVKKVVIFRESRPIFREFVEDVYAMRLKAKEEGNKGKSYLLKLILNSLYGKFAQKPLRDKIKIISEYDVINEQGEVFHNGEFFYTREKEFKPAVFYMPFISAYITSYARVKLHEYLCQAVEPVYCDTDSVYCLELRENSKEMGFMKLERTLHKFRAFNPKVYQSVEVMKAKGIPRHILNDTKDLSVFYSEPAEWETLCSIRRSLTVKNNVSYEKGLVKYVKMSRRFVSKYNKREVLEDGATRPLWLVDDCLTPLLLHKSLDTNRINQKRAQR